MNCTPHSLRIRLVPPATKHMSTPPAAHSSLCLLSASSSLLTVSPSLPPSTSLQALSCSSSHKLWWSTADYYCWLRYERDNNICYCLTVGIECIIRLVQLAWLVWSVAFTDDGLISHNAMLDYIVLDLLYLYSV